MRLSGMVKHLKGEDCPRTCPGAGSKREKALFPDAIEFVEELSIDCSFSLLKSRGSLCLGSASELGLDSMGDGKISGAMVQQVIRHRFSSVSEQCVEGR